MFIIYFINYKINGKHKQCIFMSKNYYVKHNKNM